MIAIPLAINLTSADKHRSSPLWQPYDTCLVQYAKCDVTNRDALTIINKKYPLVI